MKIAYEPSVREQLMQQLEARAFAATLPHLVFTDDSLSPAEVAELDFLWKTREHQVWYDAMTAAAEAGC